MEELITREYDNYFKEIAGLNSFPWVGKCYKNSNRRLLIVGESHYLNPDNPNTSGFELTRECIFECPINEEWHNRTYMTINKVLCNEKLVDNKTLWDKIAYYNFIPRIMDTNSDRPTDDEFINAWKSYMEIVELLKPTDCIFMGVLASNSYNRAMEKFQINYNSVEILGKIGKVSPRSTSLQIADYNMKINFILHPSRINNSEVWFNFLNENSKEAIQFLEENVSKVQAI